MRIQSKTQNQPKRVVISIPKNASITSSSSPEAISNTNTIKSAGRNNKPHKVNIEDLIHDQTVSYYSNSLAGFNTHTKQIKSKLAQLSDLVNKESQSSKINSNSHHYLNPYSQSAFPDMSFVNNTQFNKSTVNSMRNATIQDTSSACYRTYDSGKMNEIYLTNQNLLSEETKISLLSLQSNINIVQQRLNNILNGNSNLFTDQNQENSVSCNHSEISGRPIVSHIATKTKFIDQTKNTYDYCSCCAHSSSAKHISFKERDACPRYFDQTLTTINKTSYNTLDTVAHYEKKYHKKVESKYKRKLYKREFDLSKYKGLYMSISSISRSASKAQSPSKNGRVSRNLARNPYNTIQSHLTNLDTGYCYITDKGFRNKNMGLTKSNTALIVESFNVNLQQQKSEVVEKVRRQTDRLSITEMINVEAVSNSEKHKSPIVEMTKCENLTLTGNKELKHAPSEDIIMHETSEFNDDWNIDLNLDGHSKDRTEVRHNTSPLNLKIHHSGGRKISHIDKCERSNDRDFLHNESSVNLGFTESADSKMGRASLTKHKASDNREKDGIDSYSPTKGLSNSNSKASQVLHQHQKTGTFGSDHNIDFIKANSKKLNVEPLEEEDEGSISKLASIHLYSPRISKQNNSTILRESKLNVSGTNQYVGNNDDSKMKSFTGQTTEPRCETPNVKSKSSINDISQTLKPIPSPSSKIIPLIPVISHKKASMTSIDATSLPLDPTSGSKSVFLSDDILSSDIKKSKSRKTVMITDSYIRMEYDLLSKVKHYILIDENGLKITSQPQRVNQLFEHSFKSKHKSKSILILEKSDSEEKKKGLDKLNRLIFECNNDSDNEEDELTDGRKSRSRSVKENDTRKSSARLSSNHKRITKVSTKKQSNLPIDEKARKALLEEQAEEAVKLEHERRINLVKKIRMERSQRSTRRKVKKHKDLEERPLCEKFKSNPLKFFSETPTKLELNAMRLSGSTILGCTSRHHSHSSKNS